VQTRRRLAAPPANRSFVPGRNASVSIASVGALRVYSLTPFATSQILMDLSAEADASKVPDALKATAYTASVCSFSTPVGFPVAVSQTRMSLSYPHDARRLPSGLNATW